MCLIVMVHYTNRVSTFPCIRLYYRQEFLSPVLQGHWTIPHTLNVFILYDDYDYYSRKIVEQQSFRGLYLLIKAPKSSLHTL